MKVFVSHFSGDEWVAKQMCKEIQALGAETFIDAVDIHKGDVFEDEIREALDSSDELVVLLTPEALARPYVWMEVGAAWVQKKRIVGVLYRLTAGDISTRERTPALLKSINLCDLNGEFEPPPAAAKSPELPEPGALANHDESRRLRTGDTGEDPLALLAGYLTQLTAAPAREVRVPSEADLRRARDDWLRRLQTSRRSKSTLTAYRVAIDDLLDWSRDHGRNVFEEATIVDHLAAYQRRAQPAPATYYRRFGLLRRFVHWLSRRSGLPDPFLELEPPPKPQQEADWLTEDEFGRLLAAAEHPRRCRKGLAERDRLVLLALVQTSLRRSELIALSWCDVDFASERPSLLVRQGKGAKPRRQPLAPQLAEELQQLRDERQPAPSDPVFCGLEGKRLQPTILAGIISRAAEGAGLPKRVTAHTLRHTAATWLRQQTGDARLVAAYLGHADLSTVSRYAHVAEDELHDAAAMLAKRVENTPRRRAA